ncbi:MAG: hypothetical protein QOC81_3540 [Thermoanaerobaculia bacterium]|jgi:hypothetical protein|nr:hypothetical protein [Thermoanaerobaculia bacterium]
MESFPAEFEELLTRRAKRELDDPPQLEAAIARRHAPILFFENAIEPKLAKECIRLLDRVMYPVLRRMETPIPREELTGMKENYTERLPKTLRTRTAILNSRKSKAMDAANEIGLSAMMNSRSFRQVAQAVTHSPLCTKGWGRQVICYGSGDYSGPHNDHHPEEPNTCNGFIDLHIMFSNDDVSQQLLIYEERRFLSVSHDVSRSGAVAIYRLPFWHYTTPLLARPGREQSARRWLLLGSFDYDPPLERLDY